MQPCSSHLQRLHLYRGPGWPQHATPVATWHTRPAAHHRDSGGQLPRDHGQAADCASPTCFSCPLDTGLAIHWWEHAAQVHDLWWEGLHGGRGPGGVCGEAVHTRLPGRGLLCEWSFLHESIAVLVCACLHWNGLVPFLFCRVYSCY